MKLNNECVRDLMLYIEDNLELGNYIDVATIEELEYSIDILLYTAIKLHEAGYTNSTIDLDIENQPEVIIHSITWQGHKFLDNIRDDKVWKTTKNIISKFSSVSFSIIEKISAQVITNLINQYMGQ